MSTMTDFRPAIRNLIHELRFRKYSPADGPKAWPLTQCWLSREDTSRYALIVPAMYGPLDFSRLVAVATVSEAVDLGLVSLSEPLPMPPYNYGGPRYRWRTIQQGYVLALASTGGVL